ncbi:hypothetical protein GW17_00020859 [Ensete ventricosum]|nr:hypothetical protein GW17_00020859 [Ensete ventricosum]
MPVRVRLKTSVHSKLKVSTEHGKEAGIANSSKRRNQMSRENTKADGIKCNSEPYRRAKIREVNSRSLSGGKQQQLGREGKFESDDVKGSFGSEPRDRKRKNADATRKTRVRENSAFSMKRKLSEAAVFRRRGSHVKREIIDEDDSYADEGSNDRASVLRGQSVKSNTSRGKKGGKKGDIEGGGASDDASRVKLRSKLINSLETSADNLRLKGKEIRRVMSADRHVVGSGDEVSEKYAGKKDKAGPIAEQKHQRYQTRVLDKSGKKIRISRKALADGTEETGRPLKKKKRVIKIDPYDISNKRLDDSVFINAGHFRQALEMESVFKKVFCQKKEQESSNPALKNLNSEGQGIVLGFGKALYRLVHIGPTVDWYADRPLLGGTAKIDRRRSIEGEKEKKKEEDTYLLSPRRPRPWAILLPHEETEWNISPPREEDRGDVKEYVSTRIGLQQVCVLIDTKWGMKQRDHELIDLMERCDEMMVSSKSGAGIGNLRTVLAKLARFVKP